MIEIFTYDKKSNKVKKLEILDQVKRIKDNLIWVDVTNITKDEENLLQKTFNLHSLTAEDLFNSGVRIKIEEFNEYLFSVFYAIKKTNKINLIEMDFIIGENFLITNHKEPLDSINKLKMDENRVCDLCKKGLDFLFHKILDMEVDNYIPTLDDIDDQIESIQEEITIEMNKGTMTKILFQKRQIVKIKKIVLPQREKISMLAKNEMPFISKKSLPYFRDVYDHSIRISDSIDNYREAIGSTFDAYMSAVSNNMNEVMKVLSIIATITLPLTVVSGIYGTNFITLPGSTNENGFWVMIGFMAIMMFGMLFYFRRRKWI